MPRKRRGYPAMRGRARTSIPNPKKVGHKGVSGHTGWFGKGQFSGSGSTLYKNRKRRKGWTLGRVAGPIKRGR